MVRPVRRELCTILTEFWTKMATDLQRFAMTVPLASPHLLVTVTVVHATRKCRLWNKAISVSYFPKKWTQSLKHRMNTTAIIIQKNCGRLSAVKTKKPSPLLRFAEDWNPALQGFHRSRSQLLQGCSVFL